MEPTPYFFGLAWVMPSKVIDLFACWRGQLGSPQSEAIWKMIPLYLLWYIHIDGFFFFFFFFLISRNELLKL
jgi:hypothetical protein